MAFAVSHRVGPAKEADCWAKVADPLALVGPSSVLWDIMNKGNCGIEAALFSTLLDLAARLRIDIEERRVTGKRAENRQRAICGLRLKEYLSQ